MRKVLLMLLLIGMAPFAAVAQHTDNAGLKQLKFYEDSLKKLARILVDNDNALERKNANYTFIKTLVGVLKTPDSFHYPFDSLKNISIVNAPDNKFRILAWHIMNDDGSYRFYGAVQMNTVNLQLFPLEDYSPLLKNAEDSVTDNRKWYGAQYYKIIEVTAATPYYVLLGWKGNTIRSTKKVIDALSFKNGKPQFGLPVFDGNNKTRSRVIFEYTRQASMVLRYTHQQHLIVFDHLSPPEPKLKGKPETYGPDMTYSGYRLKAGRWIYTDNLDMRNVPDASDEKYIDPKQQALLDRDAAIKNKSH